MKLLKKAEAVIEDRIAVGKGRCKKCSFDCSKYNFHCPVLLEKCICLVTKEETQEKLKMECYTILKEAGLAR